MAKPNIPVWNPDDGYVFESIAEASRFYDINAANISAQIKGKRNHIGNMRFEVLDREEALSLGFSFNVAKSSAVPVICKNDGKRYRTISAAAEAYGLDPSSVSRHMIRKTPNIHGYVFARLREGEA